MSMINRNLDASEQREVVGHFAAAFATGATQLVAHISTPCILDKAQFAAFGLSGAPTAQLVVNRFIVGTGFTAINVGSANVLPAFGTSGVLAVGASLPAAGSTLLNLYQNDMIQVLLGGTNSAVLGFSTQLVLRPVQDIVVRFGLI